MKRYVNLSLKIVATLVATAVGFWLGGVMTGFWYDRMILPGLLKKYSHDGQIGLEEFLSIFYGACAGAVVVFVAGMMLVFRTGRNDRHRAIEKSV